MTDQSILREIQLAVLGMLREFDAVCKRNGIRYFAMCGTLLGAVRNQGFIPWDDDVDLAILREDFNKLKRLPREEWGEKLEFVTAADDDLRHDHIFPRVYLKNYRIQSYDDVENWIDPTTGKAWSTGLFLDLYIFERISDNDREYRRTLAMKPIIRRRPGFGREGGFIDTCTEKSPGRSGKRPGDGWTADSAPGLKPPGRVSRSAVTMPPSESTGALTATSCGRRIYSPWGGCPLKT